MNSMRGKNDFGAIRSRNWLTTLNQTIVDRTGKPEDSMDRDDGKRLSGLLRPYGVLGDRSRSLGRK
jgi:hypothetical protein